MTAALEGGEWSAARPGRTLPPGKTRYPLYRRLGGPQGRSGRVENLVPIGIQSRTVQPVAQSLYRLSYRAHETYSTLTFRIQDAARSVEQQCTAATAHIHRIGYELQVPVSASLIHCSHLKHLNFYTSSYVILFQPSSSIICTRVPLVCSNICRSVLFFVPA